MASTQNVDVPGVFPFYSQWVISSENSFSPTFSFYKTYLGSSFLLSITVPQPSSSMFVDDKKVWG
jgi:hypothetical protein